LDELPHESLVEFNQVFDGEDRVVSHCWLLLAQPFDQQPQGIRLPELCRNFANICKVGCDFFPYCRCQSTQLTSVEELLGFFLIRLFILHVLLDRVEAEALCFLGSIRLHLQQQL